MKPKIWTKEGIQALIKENMSDYMFVVVSSRQPYMHVFKKGKIECHRGTGGVVTALDPIMRACNGLWVAYGNGDADSKVTDAKGKLRVPPNGPSYTLKRVFLTKEEEDGFYFGYSNQALWPLCHMTFQRPVFREQDWNHYCKVNKKFAGTVLDEIGNKKAFVWIQDYHFTLLPKYLKEAASNQLIVAHFWHIPWPNHEVFRICPQRHQILEGMLASDLLGFHIRYHCDNFLDAIDRELQSKINREKFSVIRGEHETLIRPYPISVDFEGLNETANQPKIRKVVKSLKQEHNLSGKKILLGVDRIDYTKGIPERLLAVDRLFEKYPGLKEKVVFLQIGVISRIHIPRYRQLNDEINALVEEINWKHSTADWDPIIMARHHLSYEELLAFYKMCNVCIISSLHDGMNLVAKEFISSRADENAALVLSRFTGAARELDDAILINPYNRENFCDSIYEALNFTKEERRKRMKKMRRTVRQGNIYRWAGKLLSELLKFEFEE
ncbi:MAG: trehalose-6-phosphate synthase [Candidatus Omnitrophota bacterium]|nr:trehalose-6-phosphate synthase [Candidatus Omnitrophota bacterium]